MARRQQVRRLLIGAVLAATLAACAAQPKEQVAAVCADRAQRGQFNVAVVWPLNLTLVKTCNATCWAAKRACAATKKAGS